MCLADITPRIIVMHTTALIPGGTLMSTTVIQSRLPIIMDIHPVMSRIHGMDLTGTHLEATLWAAVYS